MLEGILDRMGMHGGRRRAPLLAVAALAVLGALAAAASPALALNPKVEEELAPFKQCPVYSGAVACVAGTTTEGEFVLGKKAVTINKTVTLQGGLASEGLEVGESVPLLGATNGETLSKTPLTEPGGLTGLELLGLEPGGEVTATAELAGPPSSVLINKIAFAISSRNETAVTLPVKVKLNNELLGEECYIGSDAEPIVLHLRTGTTDPPSPATPITGSEGKPVGIDHNLIVDFEHSILVDNDFSVPGASGCGPSGLSSVVDEVIDTDVGLPSSPGESKAIMEGSLEETAASVAKKVIPKPKKAKK